LPSFHMNTILSEMASIEGLVNAKWKTISPAGETKNVKALHFVTMKKEVLKKRDCGLNNIFKSSIVS